MAGFYSVSREFTSKVARRGIAVRGCHAAQPRRASTPNDSGVVDLECDRAEPRAARGIWPSFIGKAALPATGRTSAAAPPARCGTPAASVYASLPPRRDKAQD